MRSVQIKKKTIKNLIDERFSEGNNEFSALLLKLTVTNLIAER